MKSALRSLACSTLLIAGATALAKPAFATPAIVETGIGTYCSGIFEIIDKRYGGHTMDSLTMWPSRESTDLIYMEVPDAFMPSVLSFLGGHCFCIDYAYQTKQWHYNGYANTEKVATGPARACGRKLTRTHRALTTAPFRLHD